MQLQLKVGDSWVRVTLPALFLFLFVGCISSAGEEDGNYVEASPELLRACMTAYLEFRIHVKARRVADGEAIASKIDDYKIAAYPDKHRFVIEFSPRPAHGALVATASPGTASMRPAKRSWMYRNSAAVDGNDAARVGAAISSCLS